MRTSKEQKLINFIIGTGLVRKENFNSVIRTQEVVYRGKNAYVVEYSHIINEETTTCSKTTITHSEMMGFHKGKYDLWMYINRNRLN